ncbi:hypothetical protein FF36_00226 [Frankia torreyi]|uniref:Uncharacterized protein n=1 Tax=Frankia torreyi TaxID=1856 RepID=A0A0D8BNA8_9ACTN|nr:hypothetical protein FF36_00226 [Frankia torreyi]KQM06255.1 hypothetical protein FF86_1010132 [Frankia sp. CpI1-P]
MTKIMADCADTRIGGAKRLLHESDFYLRDRRLPELRVIGRDRVRRGGSRPLSRRSSLSGSGRVAQRVGSVFAGAGPMGSRSNGSRSNGSTGVAWTGTVSPRDGVATDAAATSRRRATSRC